MKEGGRTTTSTSAAATLVLLSPSLRSRIRSGVAITSPSHCVEELVHNAIDAGATKVHIKVDLGCFKIQVTDNGKGILRDDLEKIGERYMTSKCHSLKDFHAGIASLGYRGEAIASLIDVCGNLQIASRSSQDKTTWLASFSKGVRNSVVPYYKQQEAPGTHVCITNFMYNMPVRQQLISPTLDLEDIQYSVTALALVHLRASLLLTDDATREKLLNTSGSSSSVAKAFVGMFGNYWNSRNLLDVRFQDKRYSVEGVVATEGSANQRKQFIFVNKRLMRKTALHKIVQNLLQQSIMCRPQQQPSKYVPNSSSSQESPTKAMKLYPIFCLQISCPREDYDVTFEPRKTEVEFSNWDLVNTLLREGLTKFLRDHLLLPPNACLEKTDEEEKTEEENPRPTISFPLSLNVTGIRALNDSDTEADVHDGGSNAEHESGSGSGGAKSNQATSRYFWDSEEARQSKPVFRNIVPPTLLPTTATATTTTPGDMSPAKKAKMGLQKWRGSFGGSSSSGADVSNTMPDGWMRKPTPGGKTFYIHLASGTVVDSVEKCHKPAAAAGQRSGGLIDVVRRPPKTRYGNLLLPAGKTPFLSRGAKLRRVSSDAESRQRVSASTSNLGLEPSSPLDDRESKWLPEERARSVTPVGVDMTGGSGETSLSVSLSLLSSWRNPNFVFESEAIEVKGGDSKHSLAAEAFTFERDMFSDLRVVGQVDLKFIACKVFKGEEEFLVLFDQHAVHERIRLEALIKENYPGEAEVVSSTVDPPLTVSLARDSSTILKRFESKVKQFGIGLGERDSASLSVDKVPKCFLVREASELKYNRPSPLMELVQGLLQDLVESIRITRGGLSVLPQTLCNVLNSQACRSAVKFGDRLSFGQCQSLIKQLERCKAPFQCAHGRPSVTPVVNVSKLEKCFPGSSSFSMRKLRELVADME